MKNAYSKIIVSGFVFTTFFACKKHDQSEGYSSEAISETAATSVSDSISSVATMKINDRQFIKTASVDMEVKDVYNATISIENTVKELGGFITQSNLRSHVISENTYNTSDTDGVMIKKYQTENSMQVRIPTENLGDFLQKVNDKKLFLNTRIIHAEDVTKTMKYAKLEAQRNANTGNNIKKLKNSREKIDLDDQNANEGNSQKLASMTMNDNLKYSTVEVYIKEPKLRVAEIPVINTKNVDNSYKFNFLYDAKNAFVEGFYIIQMLIVGIIKIWPVVLIGIGIFCFIRKKKNT